MKFAKSDLELIKSKIDMIAYLEKRDIVFKRVGTSYVALCPVHSERSPSFNVNPFRQTFHCFGCGISGDIFSLVQELDNLSFTGAVQELAEEAGVHLSAEEDPEYEKKQRLYKMLKLVSTWFRENYVALPDEHPAKQNLKARNLLEYSMTDPSVGFVPDTGLYQLLKKAKFTNEEMSAGGLFKKTEEGRLVRYFSNRLIWTIYDTQGRPIAFSARKIFNTDNGPKYINSPQTVLFNKSKALLGLYSAKKMIQQEQEVYIVEGQTDVMALKAAGKLNTVASCGTAFGTYHATMLLRLSALARNSERFKLVFCFDGDTAGVKAAKKVFTDNPGLQLNSYVVHFEDLNSKGTDPCDFRKIYGDKALQLVLQEEQVSIVEFVLKEELKTWDISTPEGQTGFIKAAKNILSGITDSLQRSNYVRLVAYWTGISHEQVSKYLQQSNRNSNPSYGDSIDSLTPDTKIEQAEQGAIALLLQYPEETVRIVKKEHIVSEMFENPTNRGLFNLLISDQAEEVDESNKYVAQLSVKNMNILPDRKEEGIRLFFKEFLKMIYNDKTQKLNTRVTQLMSETEDSNVAMQLLQQLTVEQDKLKQLYQQ